MTRALNHLRARWPIVIWLTAVWVLLWGTFSLANLINGLLVGVFVMLLVPLPRVELRGRVHPLGLLRLLLHFVADVIRASVQVSLIAVRPGPPRTSGIVGVQLRSESEFVQITTAEMLNLVPGSVTIELDTANRQLFAHVLRVDSENDIAAFRASTLALEARILRAIGSREHLEQLDAEAQAPTGVPSALEKTS